MPLSPFLKDTPILERFELSQEGGNHPGEDDSVKGTRSTDRGHPGLEAFYVLEVEEIGTYQWPQHTGCEGNRRCKSGHKKKAGDDRNQGRDKRQHADAHVGNGTCDAVTDSYIQESDTCEHDELVEAALSHAEDLIDGYGRGDQASPDINSQNHVGLNPSAEKRCPIPGNDSVQTEDAERIVDKLLFSFDSLDRDVYGTSQENPDKSHQCQFWRKPQTGKGREHGMGEENGHEKEEPEKDHNREASGSHSFFSAQKVSYGSC